MKSLSVIPKLVIYIFLFTSCAAMFSKYNNYMEKWKGQDEELVYMIYGLPMRDQTLRDGRKLIAYDYQSPGSDQPLYCSINFELKDSLVISAKKNGNLRAVQRYIKGPYAPRIVD